jgi:hypothetical protein
MESVANLVSDNWSRSVDRDVLEKYEWLQRHHPAEQTITTTATIIVLTPLANTGASHAVFSVNRVFEGEKNAKTRN